MRERFDLLSLKFARKTADCHGEGELSFSPLTHIFLSCPSPSLPPHASQSDSPLPLVFVWHYPSLEASVRLCVCAIHHRIRAFFLTARTSIMPLAIQLKTISDRTRGHGVHFRD